MTLPELVLVPFIVRKNRGSRLAAHGLSSYALKRPGGKPLRGSRMASKLSIIFWRCAVKGRISLSEFIKETKQELRSAVDEDDPFFYLDRVDLEVTFGLDVEAKVGAKFFVFDAKTSVQGVQTHKVTMSLTPFLPPSSPKLIKGSEEFQKAVKHGEEEVSEAVRRVTMDIEKQGFKLQKPLFKVELNDIDFGVGIVITEPGKE